MGSHDSSSEEEERARRRDRRRRERSPDARRSRMETEDVGRRVRVSDDEDHKTSRRDLEIGASVADGERRRGDKVRKDTTSSDEELARRSRKDRREVDSASEDDRGKRIEVDSDADGERRVSKVINKDRVRADTSSDEESGCNSFSTDNTNNLSRASPRAQG